MRKFFLCLGLLVGLGVLYLVLHSSTFFVPQQNQPTNQLKISASFYPMAFLAEQIGGDLVQVTTITPPGAEPHDYEPTAQDMLKIQQSRFLFVNGELEPWIGQVTENRRTTGTGPEIITLGQGLFSLQETNKLDPHVWLDPKKMAQMAEHVTTVLSQNDQTHASVYQARNQHLQTQLQQLDSDYRQGLATCQQRTFITTHEAFGYLAQEYDLEQKSIAGLSPDSEPSLQQLTQLADYARQNQVKYIFFEELVSPKLAQTLAQEVGAETLVLSPLESLTPDELQSGQDYFSVMRQSLAHLRLALSCP